MPERQNFEGTPTNDSTIGRGDPTPRQQEMIRLIQLGYSHREIADLLGITKATVDRSLVNARARMNCKTTAQLAAEVGMG